MIVTAVALLGGLVFNVLSAGVAYDWDLIPYVGTVNSFLEETPQAAHAKTFAEIRQRVPDAQYQYLTGVGRIRDEFRSEVAGNAEVFAQQLPFYSVKPLYPFLMYLLSTFGVDLVLASVLIAEVAYLLIGGLLMYWLSRYYASLSAGVATYLLMSTPFVLALATFSGPDSLSAFLILLGLYLFVETPHQKTAHAILVASITARPDNIMLVGLLMLYSFVFRKESRPLAVGTVAVALVLYQLQVTLSGNYGWSTLFYHSFIRFMAYPADDPFSLTFADYWGVIARESAPLMIAKTSYSFILFIVLNVFTLRLESHGSYLYSARFQVLLVSLIYSCAHWFIFPGQKERYLAAFFLFTLVMLITGANKNFGAPAKSEPETTGENDQ